MPILSNGLTERSHKGRAGNFDIIMLTQPTLFPCNATPQFLAKTVSVKKLYVKAL